MMKCRFACLSTRNSILPPLISVTALATSIVTVPVLGFGMSPRGPRILPSRPTLPIRSGVATAASKSVYPPATFSTSSSPPPSSAPASRACSARSPVAKTRTRAVLPVPCGRFTVPHGTGKTARVLVFATGERAEQAREAGADEVGGDELIEKVAGGYTDFDAAVATPDLMGKVGRLGKILGPRGLMPNPKTGTVTMDVAKAVTEIKGGKIEFRVDKHANLHFIIGKVSFEDVALVENYAAALDEVLRLKPASSKGRYIMKAVVTTTMGPSGSAVVPSGHVVLGHQVAGAVPVSYTHLRAHE